MGDRKRRLTAGERDYGEFRRSGVNTQIYSKLRRVSNAYNADDPNFIDSKGKWARGRRLSYLIVNHPMFSILILTTIVLNTVAIILHAIYRDEDHSAFVTFHQSSVSKHSYAS